MADNIVEILLRLQSEAAEAGLERFVSQLGRLTVGIGGAYEAMSKLKQMFEAGIQSVEDMSQEAASLSAILMTMERGVTAENAFAAMTEDAERLRRVSADIGVQWRTMEMISRAFAEGGVFAIDDRSARIMAEVAKYAELTAIGRHGEFRAMQMINELLMGQITPHNTIAKAIEEQKHWTEEQLKDWLATSPAVGDFLDVLDKSVGKTDELAKKAGGLGLAWGQVIEQMRENSEPFFKRVDDWLTRTLTGLANYLRWARGQTEFGLGFLGIGEAGGEAGAAAGAPVVPTPSTIRPPETKERLDRSKGEYQNYFTGVEEMSAEMVLKAEADLQKSNDAEAKFWEERMKQMRQAAIAGAETGAKFADDFIKSAERASASFANYFMRGFELVLQRHDSFWQAMLTIMQEYGAKLMSEIIKVMALNVQTGKDIFSGIGGLIGLGGGGGGLGGGRGSMVTDIGVIAGMMGSSYAKGAFAEGGLVSGPTLALLGEKGPEMVTPLGRGKAPVTINIQAWDTVTGMDKLYEHRDFITDLVGEGRDENHPMTRPE